jgi:integrase
VAWITPRAAGGYLVRWREGGRGSKVQSKVVATVEEAERVKADAENAASARHVLATTPGIPGWDTDELTPATDDKLSVAGYLRGVVERDRSLRPSSRDTYLHSIRNHLAGSPFGDTDIRYVGPDDVAGYWASLDGLGDGALRNVRQLLSKAFHTAVREGVIDVSPLERANIKAPPKRRATEIVPLSVDEIERLADAAATARDRLMVLVMAYGGLRAGEVGGLRVQDVDPAGCRIHIRQAVAQTRGAKVIGPPKTRSAIRTVTLPCSVTDELAAFADANPPAKDGRLFYSYRGRPLAHVAINHAVQKSARAAGMRPVNAHLLRHTAVSLLIDDGANPRAIQQFVGHSDIKMTLGTYGHLFDYGGAALAESLERRRDAHRRGRG